MDYKAINQGLSFNLALRTEMLKQQRINVLDLISIWQELEKLINEFKAKNFFGKVASIVTFIAKLLSLFANGKELVEKTKKLDLEITKNLFAYETIVNELDSDSVKALKVDNENYKVFAYSENINALVQPDDLCPCGTKDTYPCYDCGKPICEGCNFGETKDECNLCKACKVSRNNQDSEQ